MQQPNLRKIMLPIKIYIFFCLMTATIQQDGSQKNKIPIQPFLIMTPHIISDYSVVQQQKLGPNTDKTFQAIQKADFFVQTSSKHKTIIQGKDIMEKELQINQKQLRTEFTNQQTKTKQIQEIIAKQRQKIYKELRGQALRKQSSHDSTDYFLYLFYIFIGVMFVLILVSKSRKRKHSIPVQKQQSTQLKTSQQKQIGEGDELSSDSNQSDPE